MLSYVVITLYVIITGSVRLCTHTGAQVPHKLMFVTKLCIFLNNSVEDNRQEECIFVVRSYEVFT